LAGKNLNFDIKVVEISSWFFKKILKIHMHYLTKKEIF
jgi:FKBP-type peptidyl-prolyl cis-trans isomerase 2